jgi:hypothetical protein
MKRRLALIPILMLLAAPLGRSQQEPKFTTKVYYVKWQRASEMVRMLGPFHGTLSASDALNTVTAMTDEQGHALVAATIQRYDTRPRTIEFQFYLIRASSTAGSGSPAAADGLPDKIRRVVGEVAALTRFRTFELLDAPVLRATEGRGTQLSGKSTYFYRLGLGGGRGPSIVALDETKRQIIVDEFQVTFSIPVDMGDAKLAFRDVGVSTALSLQDGETVVVGSSRIQEQGKESAIAMITVVTGRIVS